MGWVSENPVTGDIQADAAWLLQKAFRQWDHAWGSSTGWFYETYPEEKSIPDSFYTKTLKFIFHRLLTFDLTFYKVASDW